MTVPYYSCVSRAGLLGFYADEILVIISAEITYVITS